MTGSALQIAIFAGPSGGHLFPALAYAEALRERLPNSERFLISSRRAENFVVSDHYFDSGLFKDIFYLREFPFPAGLSLRSLQFLLEFPRAFIESSQILNKIKPDLCAGFGSFVSYPGMRLAAWRKIPNFIHEQNVVPGKATQMLVSSAQFTALTFDNTFQKRQIRLKETVGLPIRTVLRSAADASRPQNKPNRFEILVVGGSQGAHGLNQKILDAFSRFSSEEKKTFAVIHITGRSDFEWVEKTYRENRIQAEVHAFYSKMQELYGRADMAITRAGANTLFELALFKIPAVVIPYPYAGGHQAENADYFEKQGALLAHPESSLSPDWLCEQIRTFQKSPERRAQLSEKIAKLAGGDAAAKLVDWTQRLIKGETSYANH